MNTVGEQILKDDTTLDTDVTIMTEEEMEIFQEEKELYQPHYQTILKTDMMPLEPIEPTLLATKVKEQLELRNVFVSSKTLPIIEEMCRLFNFNIQDKSKGYTTTAYVYPAQTGIGKSITLQVYVSMLTKESSLIVVSKVEEALNYCKFINTLSEDENYARCYYSITDKNAKDPLRVHSYQLNQYRCIVMTHNMFRNLNQNSKKLDEFKLYNAEQRDLVVIDEKLSFYEKYEISFRQIEKLIGVIENILESTALGQKLKAKKKEQIKLFIRLMKIHMKRYEKAIDLEVKPTKMIIKEDLDAMLLEHGLDFQKVIRRIAMLIRLRTKELFAELKTIGNNSNTNYEQTIANNAKRPFDEIKGMYKDWFVFYKSNYEKKFFRVENIVNQLGPSIVLDATASINEFYQIANRYWGFVGFVPAEQIRKYENMTVYKATGFNQSRSGIYKNKDENFINKTASMYLSYVHRILASSSDKLLIICHKEFKDYLQAQSSDARIVFTNWGNHVGRNDWSDCNKVMIIGWNYLNPLEHISHFCNAVGRVDEASYFINHTVLKAFEVTQLADDLVQAVMRSKARIIATEDSDCHPTEVYLFYQNNADSARVLQIFESQFPQATIVDWEPKGLPRFSRKTAIEKTADDCIHYLSSIEATHQTCLLSTLKKELGISASKTSYVLASDYFKEELDKKGYLLKHTNGKSKHFILK